MKYTFKESRRKHGENVASHSYDVFLDGIKRGEITRMGNYMWYVFLGDELSDTGRDFRTLREAKAAFVNGEFN